MTSSIEPNLGAPAPEFNLPASSGGVITIGDFRGKNNVYLFFVREYN